MDEDTLNPFEKYSVGRNCRSGEVSMPVSLGAFCEEKTNKQTKEERKKERTKTKWRGRRTKSMGVGCVERM